MSARPRRHLQEAHRSSDVFFGDQPILLDAALRIFAGQDLIILDRLFTYEPLALALTRGDDDFRLIVDATLSRLFKSDEVRDLYEKWCGKPGPGATIFFNLSALPE
jgi:polar amino acid transport system substrate-binding protein